ncbi:MAG: hypothetical protein AMXMBFR53_16080 [Gemmatimonadota bacterium]
MRRTATALPALAALALAGACAPGGSAPPPPEPEPDPGLYSDTQADRGRDAFRASCAECHYSSEFRGSQFQFAWRRRSVGDLFTEIVRNMPEDAPGSLEDQVYVDIVAYILQLNGFPAGSRELPPDQAVLGRHSMAAPAGAAPSGERP